MIKLENIRLGYGERTLAEGVSFSLDKGELVLLCGPNGCGKSTLLRYIARTYPDLVAMVPTRIPKVKGFTSREFLRGSLFSERHPSAELIDGTLASMGLESLADKDISTFSDGEFQKLCIASGLVREKPFLLLDEPTAFLDAWNRILVLDCLKSIVEKKGITILFSSHDLHESLERAGKVLAFTGNGEFVSGGREAAIKAFPGIKESEL